MQGDKTEKKKYEPPVPTRVGKKRKKVKVRNNMTSSAKLESSVSPIKVCKRKNVKCTVPVPEHA